MARYDLVNPFERVFGARQIHIAVGFSLGLCTHKVGKASDRVITVVFTAKIPTRPEPFGVVNSLLIVKHSFALVVARAWLILRWVKDLVLALSFSETTSIVGSLLA